MSVNLFHLDGMRVGKTYGSVVILAGAGNVELSDGNFGNTGGGKSSDGFSDLSTHASAIKDAMLVEFSYHCLHRLGLLITRDGFGCL
jgi:hypothetical protein